MSQSLNPDIAGALKVPAADGAAIEQAIASDASPVGIDAKLTHVLILHKLIAIEERLTRLEAAVGSNED